MNIAGLIADKLADSAGLTQTEMAELLTVPPRREMGDIAFPCFRLARTRRKAPVLIAEDLKSELDGLLKDEMAPLAQVIARIEAAGGYVNFFVRRDFFARQVLRESIDAGGRPGATREGAGKTVIIDYSSPNIAKPFHVGHGFSTFLGEALANLFEYAGYRVERFNHLGDYGTQFGKLIVAWKRWGDMNALENAPIRELTRIYVKFHEEAEKDPALDDEARHAFSRLEQGSPEEVELWRKFRDMSLSEFNRIYDRTHIRFDNTNGESFYSAMAPDVVALLRDKGLLEESEGAQVVNLEDRGLNPCLILKNDGSTIYATRDIAAILYRDRVFHFDKNIYVVGIPQKNHFKQVFAVMDKLGFPDADRCVHVAFGTVRFEEGKFATRTGNVILLEDLLDTSVAKTRAIIAASNPDMDEAEMDAIAERVGIGAVRNAYLKNGRERDIIFSWDDMLDFEGETAPYLLYTVTRCESLIRKADEAVLDRLSRQLDEDFARLTEDDEQTVLKEIARFPESVAAAREHYEPSMMTRQLMLIARAFNTYYHNHPILRAGSETLAAARLALTQAVARTLTAGLKIAGIETVERM